MNLFDTDLGHLGNAGFTCLEKQTSDCHEERHGEWLW